MGRKRLVIGILAHVDAGKTTLAESMLYLSGIIRNAGRVDHGDTFLDTDSQERSRGITIFSKQAEISWGEMDVSLLDTPGHVDFSAEMERTLQVLDYAVLVISGADGIQGHVPTLWRLLERYRIPVFIFVNKMDQPGTDKSNLMRELQERLSGQCVDFTAETETFMESIAVCDEKLLNRYLEHGNDGVREEDIAALAAERKLFPCYFGSALKIEGVKEFLDGLEKYSKQPIYPESFGARIYKIGRDGSGNRLTHMKITGGRMQVKQILNGESNANGETEAWEEKVNQIRIYSGVKYDVEQEAVAGTICAVTGLSRTFAGEGLGIEQGSIEPLLAPVMTYRVNIPPEQDVHVMYKKLCQLEEEEPQLHVVWKEHVSEIHIQLMGEVQIEILQNLIEERFGVAVEFDVGSIVYKETIGNKVEGVGHFEPLRHYAEVHLIMEPLEVGSGLVFETICSEDVLDRNWQRLILTHLKEKEHLGILTGSPITDMKITLAAGRAHLKHTEGGDFRQAVYRAIRQGLHQAENVLLEPVYEFRLELPSAVIGRAMSDIQAMHGYFNPPLAEGEISVLTGTAPVSTMRGYHTEVMAYSGGSGRLFCSLKGYEPCHNTEEAIAACGYDAERDLDNPSASVFCAHGAGFVVEWQDVGKYMHLESVLDKLEKDEDEGAYGQDGMRLGAKNKNGAEGNGGYYAAKANDKELEEIFNRTYGSRSNDNRKKPGNPKIIRAEEQVEYYSGNKKKVADDQKEDYLLVDGYNIIFAWEELSELAKSNLDSARGKLMDILSNYQGYRKMTLILVFDAYKVKGNPGSVFSYHNINVVYTKEAETADQYIEKVTHEIGRKHRVAVATSDGLEQLIIMGQGARRISARELKEEIMSTNQELRDLFLNKTTSDRQYLFDKLPEELSKHIEDVRLGKEEF
ncbi:MAG: TetM/TetW/TetO/TetS family tetracycline resistance ribosomal protection protein [Lachnospiraceae bacterium]|nr:TetM/TetW/TetO/TetS family tetracycline resistance ribosomal protection protein [Lachnospiraceae bacterium]